MSTEKQELQKITASRGVVVVNDTDLLTRSFDAISVLESTVFTSLLVDGVDVLANYITTPANAVEAGALITAQGGQQFSGVELTSGSVIVIL